MLSFRLALSFLTIIPVGKIGKISDSKWADSAIYYPVCGYIIAFLAVFPAFLLNYLLSPDPLLLAAIAVSLLAIITGALHLDGFADVCDGFFCPVESKKRRIEIMHDSHVGSFGVVGLILLFLIKFVSLYILLRSECCLTISAVIVLARFFIVLLAAVSRYPAGEGIGKFIIGKVPGKNVLICIVMIIPCLLSLKLLITAGLLLLMVLLLRMASNKLIGGVTGDVLGACSEICEMFGLVVLAVIITVP